jgi:putative transposase
MCRVIEVSKSGFYRWMKRQRVHDPPYERYLLIRIKEAFEQSKRTYGSRRITLKLKSQGVICYKNQIARIMKKYGIKAKTKRKFKHTTDSKHNLKVAPNLLERNFKSDAINKVWVGDITYIWTIEGWLYLSIIIDLYSRKVVGWSLYKRMTKQLVISSLEAAIAMRRPKKGLIFHSDRGSQYASDDFKEVLKGVNAQQSMSRKGNCWDNAVAESFFKTIKCELIYWKKYQTRYEAEMSIFEYIEMFYNRSRLHSVSNYLSPDDFERKKLS